MLTKVDYNQSSVKDYNDKQSNSSHKYLDLVFVPANWDLFDIANDQGRTRFRIQVFPPRKPNSNEVDTVFEAALIEQFNNKQIKNQYCDYIEVEVTPHHRSYGNGVSGVTPSAIITDAVTGQPRVYTTVRLSAICDLKNGVEVPRETKSYYESRAKNLLKARLNQSDPNGKWYLPASQSNDSNPTADDVDIADILQGADVREQQEQQKGVGTILRSSFPYSLRGLQDNQHHSNHNYDIRSIIILSLV